MAILPSIGTVPVNCLANRHFTIKMTQFTLTPSVAATVYKLQGKTCEEILAHVFDERGKQNTSLYVVCSRVTELKGLFIYKRLIHEDFRYFILSKSVIEEENRIDDL